jgi:hypothetical protein
MNIYDDLPEGFYMLSSPETPEVALVKILTNQDIKVVAFGSWDGGDVVPVAVLRHDTVLTPASIAASLTTTPTCALDPSPKRILRLS